MLLLPSSYVILFESTNGINVHDGLGYSSGFGTTAIVGFTNSNQYVDIIWNLIDMSKLWHHDKATIIYISSKLAQVASYFVAIKTFQAQLLNLDTVKFLPTYSTFWNAQYSLYYFHLAWSYWVSSM